VLARAGKIMMTIEERKGYMIMDQEIKSESYLIK
jgi:hypothetical protein